MTRYLSCNHKTVIDPVIQINIFLSPGKFIPSDDRHIRQRLRRILKARNKEDKKGTEMRIFQIPGINFQAKGYTHFIYRDMCVVTSPPILEKISNHELKTLKIGKKLQALFLYPCNTPAVKCYIKLTTD